MASLRSFSVAVFLLPLACGGGLTPDAVGSGTVSGSVLDLDGNPMAGSFNVLLDGQVQSTWPDGSFSFSNVPATYDLTVAWGSGAAVYQGMTTRSPLFHFSSVFKFAQVTVQLPAPIDDTHRIVFFATGTQGGTTQVGMYPGTGNTVSFSYFQKGGVTPPVALHALTYETDPATKMLTKWTGHAELDDVHLDAPLPMWVVQPSPVETGTISVSVDVPTDITLEKMALALHLEPDDGRVPLTEVLTTTPSTQFSVPIVPGVSFDTLAEGTTSDGYTKTWARNVTAGTTVALGFNDVPPHVVAPNDGATEVTPHTRFSFAPYDRGVQMVTFYPPQSDPNYFSVQMFTTGTTVTIPDFSVLGHPLPKGEVYTWSVARMSLGKTVDEASAAPIIDGSISFDAESNQRQFTTAP